MSDEKWIDSTLEDIGHDTDRILGELDKMGDGTEMGALMGLLANKGIDPGIVAMLNDRRDRGDWGDGGLLILLFLIILMGGNGFGGFGRGEGVAGVDRTVVNEANYSRLLDAIGTQGTRQEDRKLTTAQELDNYAAFSELMKRGVYLPDLIKKMDEPTQETPEIIDEDILEVMESAVSDDDEVKDAYRRVVDSKNAVLRRLCLADPDFRKAHEEYQRVVRRKYVELKK